MLLRTMVTMVVLCAAAAQALHAQDWETRAWRQRHREGLQVRVAKDYYLPADQVASWPIVVLAGSATIDGRTEDDLIVVGGTVRIGPKAQIRGDVVAVGGEVHLADTAEVSGEIHDVGVVWPEIGFALREWLWGIDRGWWAAFTLAATVFRFASIMVAACLLALVAPGLIRRTGEQVAAAPLVAGIAGVAAQLLVVPLFLAVIAGLVLTIVGIPLLILMPFAVLAFLIAWLLGFTSVAALIGARLRLRARLAGDDSVVIDTAWGVIALLLLTFLGNVLAFGPSFFWPVSTALGTAGFIIEYFAWTVGLGAALLGPLDRHWRMSPPPIPSPASANA